MAIVDFREERPQEDLKVSFDEIVAKQKRIQANCFDDMSDRVWVDENIKLCFADERGREQKRNMTPRAFEQLCELAGVPSRYALKCINKNKGALAVDNINQWLEDSDKAVKVRQYIFDDTPIVRAVVSSEYSTNSNSLRVLNTIKKNVDISDYNIAFAINNFEGVKLRMTEKSEVKRNQLRATKDVGAGVFVGMAISNSEVGGGVLSVASLFWRLACTNGMIVPSSLYHVRQIHRGNSTFDDEVASGVDGYKKFYAQSGDMLENTIYKSMSEADTKLFLAHMSKDIPLSKEIIEKIDNLRKGEYRSFGDRFALINAITDIAHDFDYEKRLKMEKMAGSLFVSA